MRIALLKSRLSHLGGLEKYTLHLAKSLAALGHNIYILTTNWDDQSKTQEGIQIINVASRMPISFFHLLNFDYQCSRWLKKNSVDAVIGLDRNFTTQHYYRAGNGVHKAYLERRSNQSSFLKRASFILNPLHRLILAMEKATFESSSLKVLITNSYLVRNEVLRYYPKVAAEKVVVVHNGVEWKEFEKPFRHTFEAKKPFLQSLGVPDSHYQFLFIGNEYERKGLPRLLKALGRLNTINQNWNLCVIGKERNQRRFEDLSKEMGLERQLFFFGKRNDVRSFLQAADCLVIPSLYDPFANVTIEALAMGVYVLTSSENGGSEIIKPETGLVFQDDEELFRSLVEALDHRKTESSASLIRDTYKDYDFSHQLQKISLLVTH